MITPAAWKTSFRVSAATTGSELSGNIAAAPDGSFYVIWFDTSGRLVGRWFAANGSALTGDINLNVGAPQNYDAVAVTSDGKPHVVSGNTSGDTYLFDYSKSLVGAGAAPIETNSSIFSLYAEITAFPDGGLLVAYSAGDRGITTVLVPPQGAPSSPVSLFSDTDQTTKPHLATLDNGTFVVVYQSQLAGNSANRDVFFQMRNESLTAVVAPHTPVRGGSVLLPPKDRTGPPGLIGR